MTCNKGLRLKGIGCWPALRNRSALLHLKNRISDDSFKRPECTTLKP